MSTRKKSSLNIPATLVVGTGLILTGFALFYILSNDGIFEGEAENVHANAVPVIVEYEAPELSLYDIEGIERSLVDYRGQVVLVNLWATWCPPCKAEMPILKSYFDDHNSQGFVTIAINDGDPEDSVREFVHEYGLTFPVWLDPTYEATERAFKSLNLPSSFVIDRDGMVRLRWVGEIDRNSLEKYVTPLIME